MIDIARPENFDAHRRAAEAAFPYRTAIIESPVVREQKCGGARSFTLGPFEVVIRLRSAVAAAGEAREPARLSTTH